MTSPLAQPLQVGGITLKNRIVHGAISTKFVRDGIIQQALIDYHARRANGGAAMTVTEAMSVSATSADASRVAITDPANRDLLADMARRVGEAGAALVGQLWHNGNARHNGRSKEAAGISSRPDDLSLTVARVMDPDELDGLVEAFATSALVLKRAGFAGVELSGAHGFLIHQTLSPHLNDRGDRYGGDTRGRTEFTRAIIAAIRQQCGADFILGMKMPCDDGIAGSIDPAEAAAICHILTAEARPDYYCFSTGSHSNTLEMHLPALGESELGFGRHLRKLRGATGSIPILGIGKIIDAAKAEELVASGTADAVVLARGLLADPDWPVKLLENRQTEIIPCIACNLCWTEINRGRPIACAVNADAPNGSSCVRVAPKPERFDVVGSGVAGMELARRLAEAGHDVRLVGRSTRSGGALALLAPLVETGELVRYIDHLHERLERSGVRLVTDRADATARLVNASGGTMRRPAFDGATALPSLRDILRADDAPAIEGDHAVLFDDDHTEGTYIAAIHLARRFRRLTIVTPRASIATDVGLINAQKIHRCTQQLRVAVRPFSRIVLVEDGRTTIRNVWSDETSALDLADLVTYATPRRQNDIGYDAPRIGDAAAPRDLMAAIHDAARYAAKVAT